MLVRVKLEEASLLRELEIETYRETFSSYIQEEDLNHYFSNELSLEQIKKDLEELMSETYFVLKDEKAVGFLKFNWGEAQTEKELEDAFEIHRIYLLKAYQGEGLGKEMFDFALKQAVERDFTWAWLGVWERNFKAQAFYSQYGFEKFSEHEYVTGNTVDTDWLLKKYLK